MEKYDEADLENIKEELADIFAYSILLANKYNLNISDIILDKIEKNRVKYPIDKSKGSSKKYNQQ